MKLTIDIKTLLAALNRAKPVSTGRVTLPVLSCFLLTAGESLDISASDCDLFISTSAAANVTEQGAVCVSASRLLSAVAALVGGEVEISVDAKHVLSLKQGARLIRLLGIKAEEFVPAPALERETTFDLDATTFRKALSVCSPFESVDASRYVLNGVAMQRDKATNQLAFIATDGRSLRCHRLDADAEADCIIPSSAVSLFVSLIDSLDATESPALHVSLNDSLLRIESNRWTVTTKLIEGNYPNWRQVLPAASKLSAIAPREAWLDAIRVASVTTQANKDNDPRFKVTVSKRGVDLSSECPDVGNSSIPVDGATGSGELTITLSSKYLKAAIASFNSEEIRLQFIDDSSATKIEDASGVFVVMPFRTA